MRIRLAYEYNIEEAYLKTLKWVNKLRKQHGAPTLAEMAMGVPRSGVFCSVARSIDPSCTVHGKYLTVGRTNSTEFTDYEAIRLPGYVKSFTEYFDNGAYPDLVAERSAFV